MEENQEPVKKRRGRPKKNPIEPVQETQTTQIEQESIQEEKKATAVLELPHCICCGAIHGMNQRKVSKFTSLPLKTINPNPNADEVFIEPETEVAMCTECSQEYLKANNLRFAQPQLVRKYPKIGRNDKCPCGSSKKYKNCHQTENHNAIVPIKMMQ